MRLIPDGRDVIAPRRRRIEIRARGFSNLGALFWASRVVVHALARRWQVGNTHSIDYMPGLKDKFSIRQQSAEKRREFANRVVAFLQDRHKPWSGSGVAGDVSWVHTQYMREMLEANPKVVLVFQYREECPTLCLPATAPPSFRPPAPPPRQRRPSVRGPWCPPLSMAPPRSLRTFYVRYSCHLEDVDRWYDSVVKQKPKVGLPETLLLAGYGITGEKVVCLFSKPRQRF